MLGLKEGEENVGKKFLVHNEHKGEKTGVCRCDRKHQCLIKLPLLA